MSIIAEALKKAQKEREVPPPKSSVDLIPSTLHVLTPKVTALKKSGIPLALASFSLLAAALVVFFTLMFRASEKPSVTPDISVKTQDIPAGLQGEATLTPPPSTGRFPAIDEPADPLKRTFTGPRPELTGIMYSRVSPKAIVGGRMVSEGDTIDGRTVLKILPESVILSSEGQKEEIRLP
ncbi:MAG: hypothetical protein PHT95_01930 [Candidatus Omnitrophica bacterium]|nr:hypothetical protein [Candidatus Omnitrophota bacterium]